MLNVDDSQEIDEKNEKLAILLMNDDDASSSRVSYFSIYVVFSIISDSYHILITMQFLREFRIWED